MKYQCRICLEDEDELDKLISPCLCNGTMKYVHYECLHKWVVFNDIENPKVDLYESIFRKNIYRKWNVKPN